MFDVRAATPVGGQLGGGLPAVTRGVGLLKGLARQMPLDAYLGDVKLPRPRLLAQPDPSPNAGWAWFVGEHVEDYLLHGNAVHIVTARDNSGLPLAVRWVPAQWIGITTDGFLGDGVRYWLQGREVPAADVVHVRRGADRWNPARGVGIVEQHLGAWGKLQDQQRYESTAYSEAGVPSVAIIAPNQDLSQEEADAAAERWQAKFAERKPAVLPAGTEVKPLTWSPSDAQLVEAHQMSLQDVANMLGIDGAWLGAPTKGLTYKSVGPLFLQLVREALEPITDDFEQVWGNAWLPAGQTAHFDKLAILGDSPAEEMGWIAPAIELGVIDVDEGRTRLGYGARTQPAGAVDDTARDADADAAAAVVAQKVYLAVDKVLSQDEARDLVRRAGAVLDDDPPLADLTPNDNPDPTDDEEAADADR